ncbi:MAG: nicotinate-nucleotide adenylyltransferase [Bacillota bacterium]
MLAKNNKIVIFGGTFDPPHYGHLIMAEAAREQIGSDKVIFLPAGIPPHKSSQNISPAEDRFNMLNLAIAANPAFQISRLEINEEGPSYTAQTLAYFKKQGYHVTFIIGADSLSEIFTWKEPEYLLDNSRLIVLPRPGYEIDEILAESKFDGYRGNVEPINSGTVEISSSQIRNKVGSKNSIKYLLPEAVIDYINCKRLYQETQKFEDTEGKLIAQIKSDLSQEISPYRLKHTNKVVELAVKLAVKARISEDRAYITALLHDICKDKNRKELIDIITRSNWQVDRLELKSTELLHAPAAAVIAEDKYLIKDREILEAIRYHTTGSANLGVLGKILFLADKIEPGKDYSGRKEIEELALKDLNRAVLMLTERTVYYLMNNNIEIHPNLIYLQNSLVEG